MVHQNLVRVTSFCRFEFPILETGDGVTKLHPKRSFEIPGLETGDAHLYAPEKKYFFLILNCEFYPGILGKKYKSYNFEQIYDLLKTYVLEHETNNQIYRTNR